MKIDFYYVKARLFPTVITAIPLLVFAHQIITPYGQSLGNIYSILPLITNLGLYAAIIFLSIQINRFIAKEVFQRIYFQEDTKMPTTDYLLWSHGFFAIETKKAIREKIHSTFNIVLLDQATEVQEEDRARNLIVHAVSQIKNKLRSNPVLFQHNIEYGFIRNLIGGSLVAVIFSGLIISYGAVNNDTILKNAGVILLFIYGTFLILSKVLIKRYGHYYAKVLYEQFLSL